MRKPDKENTQAKTKAWKLPLVSARQHAGLAHWLIQGPFHPHWNRWQLVVIHLRDVPGMPAAVKDTPNMTHEFQIVSVDPSQPEIDPDAPSNIKILAPPDSIVQFEATDDEAVKVAEMAINGIVAGKVSPDSDYREWWKQSVPNTVLHLRGMCPNQDCGCTKH